MRYGILKYLLELIEEEYGELDDDCGCYCGRKWLSVKQIVNLIKQADQEY